MKGHVHTIVNYIDDFLGCGTPTSAKPAFYTLLEHIEKLGLTISDKKLVFPNIKSVCLGVMVDTVTETLSILEKTKPSQKSGE